MEKDGYGKGLLIFSFVIAIVIFLLGFLIGNYIASTRIEQFKESEERLLFDLIALEVRESLLGEVCELSDETIWKEKYELGKMLVALEERLGKENEEVLRKKEIYEIIEIKTFMLLEKIRRACGREFNLVLYFYTNKKPKASLCEDQGKILDTIVYEHNELKKGKPVYIFAFSTETQNPASTFLREKYNITKVPSMVVNGILLSGYHSKGTILKLIE